MQFIVIAGGLGTRTKSSVPKLIRTIDRIPLFEHQISSIEKSTLKEPYSLLYILGHGAEEIRQVFTNLPSKKSFEFTLFEESRQSGTLGAILQAADFLENEVVIFYGDLFFDFDFQKFIDFGRSHDADILVCAHPNGHTFDSDTLGVTPDSNRIYDLDLKKTRGNSSPKYTLASAGIYYFKDLKNLLDNHSNSGDILEKVIAPHTNALNVFAYITLEYIKDSGTPSRLVVIEKDINNGVVARRSFRHKKKVLFLDRDETFISQQKYDGNYLTTEEFRGKIRDLNDLSIPVIVVSNQPMVAKGKSFQSVVDLHLKIDAELEHANAFVDCWYWCPHHPETGHAGETRIFKVNCSCRKPNPGLINFAHEDHNIDIRNSVLIGDSLVDFDLAKSVSLTFLHTCEFVTCEINQDHVCFKNTPNAIEYAQTLLC
jgi:HAD superfamily hydrolase (TIGR01662 family)